MNGKHSVDVLEESINDDDGIVKERKSAEGVGDGASDRLLESAHDFLREFLWLACKLADFEMRNGYFELAD